MLRWYKPTSLTSWKGLATFDPDTQIYAHYPKYPDMTPGSGCPRVASQTEMDGITKAGIWEEFNILPDHLHIDDEF